MFDDEVAATRKSPNKSPSRKRSPRKRSPAKRKVNAKLLATAARARRRALRLRQHGWQRSHRPAAMRRAALDDDSAAAGVDILPCFSPVDGVLLHVEGRQLDDKDVLRGRRAGSEEGSYRCSSVGIPGIRDAVQHAVSCAGIANHVRVTRYEDSILYANTSLNTTIASRNRHRSSSEAVQGGVQLSLSSARVGMLPVSSGMSVGQGGMGIGRHSIASRSDSDLVNMSAPTTTASASPDGGGSSENVAQMLEWVEMSVGSVWDGSCVLAAAMGDRLRFVWCVFVALLQRLCRVLP